MQKQDPLPDRVSVGFRVKPSANAHCIHLFIDFKNIAQPYTVTLPDLYISEAWMLYKWFKRMARKSPKGKKKIYTEEFRITGNLVRFVIETRVPHEYIVTIFLKGLAKPAHATGKEFKQVLKFSTTLLNVMAINFKLLLPAPVKTALHMIDMSESDIKEVVHKHQPDTVRYAAGPKIKKEVAQHIRNQQAGNEITFTITHATAGDVYNYNSDSFWAPFVKQWRLDNKDTQHPLPTTGGFEQTLKQHFHLFLQRMLETKFNDIKTMNARMIQPGQHADSYIELLDSDALYKQQCLVLEKLAFIQFMPVTITNNPYRLHVAVQPIELFKQLFDNDFKRMVQYTRELPAMAFTQTIATYCKVNVKKVGLKFEHRLGEAFK